VLSVGLQYTRHSHVPSNTSLSCPKIDPEPDTAPRLLKDNLGYRGSRAGLDLFARRCRKTMKELGLCLRAFQCGERMILEAFPFVAYHLSRDAKLLTCEASRSTSAMAIRIGPAYDASVMRRRFYIRCVQQIHQPWRREHLRSVREQCGRP
jgi:hypothetical protein